MAEKEEIKFNEQAFLLDFYSLTVDKNISITGLRKREYKNFVQLEGDPTGVMNRLLSVGAEDILNLKTHQLPLLVPQIRIFKIYHDDKGSQEREFLFNDFTTVDSIKNSITERGTDVGLMGFTWNDMGSNPGNTGLSFEAQLKLYFHSFESIFKERGNGTKFADLLVPAHQSKFPGVHDDSDFQIKAVVGWATPNDKGKVIFPDPTIMNRTRVSLLLTLTTHDIDIREDGSIHLTINYVAALEGRMMSQKADLLSFGSKADPRLLSITRRSLKTEKANLIVQEALEKEGKQDELKIQQAEEGIERYTKLIEELDQNTKNEMYKRLLAKIENPNSRRIFFFDLTPAQIKIYKLMQQESGVPNEPDRKRKLRTMTVQRRELKSKIMELGLNTKKGKPGEGETANQAVVSKLKKAKTPEEREEVLSAAKKEREENQPKDDENFTVNFFYFGDLVNAAIEIIRERGTQNPSTHPMKTPEWKQKVDAKEQFKFLLGTIVLFDVDSESYVSVPLADLPISVEYFNGWFQKNVLEAEITSLPFQQFIRTICSELVVSILGSAPLSSLAPNKPRISLTTFLAKKESLPKGGRLAITEAQEKLGSAENVNLQDISKQQQYLFLYMGGMLNDHLKGLRDDDHKLGIFHFYVGADQSIIKKISFKRTDLPYQREARIEGASGGASDNLLFSDFYNADISMLGNAIFKPGMLLFIDPVSMGITRTNDSHLLGIGGYYTVVKVENIIESGKFETNLSLVAQTSIRDIQRIETTRQASKRAVVSKTPDKKDGGVYKNPSFLGEMFSRPDWTK